MVKKTIKPVNLVSAKVRLLFNFPLRTKYIFLASIGFVFYANSILNKYAFDDVMAIEKNGYVQMGFRGIPKILTHDSYASFYNYLGGGQSGQLKGGRFRPLSEIIFAIEQQFFGNSELLPYFRHLINVLAYMACIIAIFYFLENFLLKETKHGSDMAFMASLLFAIHPLHTEVVANIKSLDELLSLFFIMLTLIYSLKYLQNKRTKYLIIGLGSFLFALLAKEYALTLVFLIPLLFYLQGGKRSVLTIVDSLPYFAVTVVYLLLRYNAIGIHTNIQSNILLINPYLHATSAQKIATEWFVLGKYLRLLIFPYPLSYDYSYNQIPYHTFSDITVFLSIAIYATIFICGIILARKKHILSFAVFFFLLPIFLVSNFAIDIGATMGERLAFHSSLGLIIILSWYCVKVITNNSEISLQTKKRVAAGILSVIGIGCFGETVIRNIQWKDDTSLFIHDVNVVPNSFLANNDAGFRYMLLSQRKENSEETTKSYLDSTSKYSRCALYFNPQYEASYLILGYVYFKQGLADSLKYCLDMAKKQNPNYPGLDSNYLVLSQLYLNKGIDFGNSGNLHESIVYMKKALSIDSTNPEIWYNAGVAYFRTQQYDSARYALYRTLQYNPGNIAAQKGLQALSQMKTQ